MQKDLNDPILPIHSPRIIEFERGDETKGFRALMLSGAPVRVIGKNKYAVSEIYCDILNKAGISYKLEK